MSHGDLERLSKEQLIELVLLLQRPEKMSCTSSKPPSTDRKVQREKSRPSGAKPGHEGHSRIISETPDEVIEHRPSCCSCCGAALTADLTAETISLHEQVELPEVKPLVTHHRRLSVCCPTCGTRVFAPVPEAARGTPFGPDASRLGDPRDDGRLCPAVWLSDRYTARAWAWGRSPNLPGAHLARDVAYAVEVSENPVPWRLQLWLQAVFALSERVTTLAASTLLLIRLECS